MSSLRFTHEKVDTGPYLCTAPRAPQEIVGYSLPTLSSTDLGPVEQEKSKKSLPSYTCYLLHIVEQSESKSHKSKNGTLRLIPTRSGQKRRKIKVRSKPKSLKGGVNKGEGEDVGGIARDQNNVSVSPLNFRRVFIFSLQQQQPWWPASARYRTCSRSTPTASSSHRWFSRAASLFTRGPIRKRDG